ncbi:MAG: LysR substrate-binding domain-containing protein, partial [Primorskyibacter sp.]
ICLDISELTGMIVSIDDVCSDNNGAFSTFTISGDNCLEVTAIEVGQESAQIVARLPFLAYDRDQLIARMTAAHFARHGLAPSTRFEVGAHLALMTLVARGLGWAVTTPLGYMRAARFHDAVAAQPLPFAPFARQIDVIARPDWDARVPQDIAATLRGLVARHVIAPATERLPWLDGELTVLE